MTPDNIQSVTDSIKEFSIIGGRSQDNFTKSATKIDFQEVLTSLASIFRRKDLAYRIEYRRPDQPVFRLRSEKEFGESVNEITVEFSEPGRVLEIKTDQPGQDIFEGLIEELRILGQMESTDKDETTRESELNLLVSRTFQAELYSEYQRWKRYESPFLVAIAHLKTDEADWQPIGRALKHEAQTRDMIGFLGQGRVAAFFPSVYDDESLKKKLSERLSARYEPEELELSFLQVPDDYDDWNSLKKRVFSPIYLTET